MIPIFTVIIIVIVNVLSIMVAAVVVFNVCTTTLTNLLNGKVDEGLSSVVQVNTAGGGAAVLQDLVFVSGSTRTNGTITFGVITPGTLDLQIFYDTEFNLAPTSTTVTPDNAVTIAADPQLGVSNTFSLTINFTNPVTDLTAQYSVSFTNQQ